MSGTFPYESYLLLAFRGLKVFSIPGVGTFVRKNLPAHLDEAHQIIYPPSEYIEFIPNQYQQVNAFVQLLEQSLNIPPHKAQAAADKIGKSLIEYLEKQKEITFPDIGKLKYTSKQELIFEPIASEIHLATFGLSPVSISVSSLSSNETRGSSNGKSTSSESLSSQAISPSGISRTPIYVVGLTVLILSVLILLMIFYSPFEKKTTNIATESANTDSVQIKQDSFKPSREEVKETGKSSSNLSNVQQKAEAASSTPLGLQGVVQDKKGFYIIVAQAANMQEAKAIAELWRQKGFSVLLVPGKTAGSYRISVGYYEQKEKALSKLNQLQREKKIPSDAWVYKKL